MMRRMMLALLLVIWVAPSAWPKFKEDEQRYLDEQFKALQDQIQALTTQLQTLNAYLQEVRKNQAEFQAIIDRQQRSLQELDQMMAQMRMGSEENSGNLKAAITQLRNETRDGFAKLGGGFVPSSPVGGGTGTSGPSTPSVAAQGYVLVAEGDTVTLDTSSLSGIHQGSSLVLYKSSDLNTRVGVLRVTQIMDGGKCRAEVVHLETGVKPEFSDVVRLE